MYSLSSLAARTGAVLLLLGGCAQAPVEDPDLGTSSYGTATDGDAPGPSALTPAASPQGTGSPAAVPAPPIPGAAQAPPTEPTMAVDGETEPGEMLEPGGAAPEAEDEAEEQPVEREDPLANITEGELVIDGMEIREDAPFPLRHTCQQDDLSPPLRWSPGPEGTRSYALVFTDLDADLNDGVFVHWVLWDIPEDVNALGEDLGSDSLPTMVPGAKQVRGWSSCLFGAPDASYLGPCSPTDPHNYEFALYALDVTALPDTDTCQQPIEIRDAIEASGAVLASTTLTAVYTP